MADDKTPETVDAASVGLHSLKPAPGAKSLAEIKTIRPSYEEIEKGIPEVKELFRDTFGI